MSRRRDYTGPSWQQPTWYLRRLDRHQELGHRERADAAAEACRRTRAAAAAEPGRDPYDLARSAIAEVLHEHQVDDREPIPTAEPIDLDTLTGAEGPKDGGCAAGPKEPSPFRRAV